MPLPLSNRETIASRIHFLGAPFDVIDRDAVIEALRAGSNQTPFRYIVTPNADHIARLSSRDDLDTCYENAWLSLCDSKPVWLLSKTRGRNLDHITGSDLTRTIFEDVLRPGDDVALIVAEDRIGVDIAKAYPAVNFRWHAPPHGILEKPQAQQAVIDFVQASPSRFVFFAIGGPQSEWLAANIKGHATARGTALCIGASLEFLTGRRKRAPLWMQRFGLEWLHRLSSEPQRLWKRYLFSVPVLLRLYIAEFTPPRQSEPRQ
ncbi:hypothetical protein VW29_16640 [Devosia limi DSM 17137]|uniref:Polymer biosynthesis protein, WecB/TagA/CpsF family n=1 Tax=Devosia limi DSM 17137 TaxID=1121477 RepID=A0A0F5LE32_9HYPH|nr:WecB/TagA/CpsF family glycosyltransferase [Devosia limi]KKB80636.1 hypothetical protein VW29_16640 [Devosia limi DSM 17137]SHE50064.1 polymer biosynthesis protein, WecB/TagA/CpsF family [Devosia limi DSM 17137]